MKNKIINVAQSSMPSFEEYCEEIRPIWDSRWLTNMGVKHRQFEQDLKEYLQTPNLALFTNGHLALETVIAAMNFPKGGEVITTPFTFASTTHAIARNGLVPVFCDIDPVSYTLDAAKLESLVTEKTVAVVPVHVYGNVCDIAAIDALAKKHGLKVIYDAAHAFGVKKDGVSTANFGDASMFSFHATKVFHTIEGGAVCFRDEALYTRLNDLKNFGIHGPEEVPYIGGNAKMNEFQASMGICNLRHLDGEIEKRRSIVMRYRERLSGVSGIRLNAPQDGVQSNYAYFPVVFDGYRLDRDAVFEKLQENGIIARKYFYPLTNGFPCYAELPSAGEEKTPIAKYVADRVLCLPLFADLAPEDADRICELILK